MQSGGLSIILYNGHGDVTQTTDDAGNILNNYDYDIWGNPMLTIEQHACGIRNFLDDFIKITL